MTSYQRVLVKDTDRFALQDFPFLEASLQQISEQTRNEPLPQKTEMLLSYAKEHRLEAKLVHEHPLLAYQIISGALPMRELEDLFEAGRNNPLFQQELEAHVRITLQAAAKNQSHKSLTPTTSNP